MKRIAILLAVILFAQLSVAQQDPQITQNMFNRLKINPAFAGSRGAICGTLINRQQWVGFEGSPSTTVFSVHSNFSVPTLRLQDNGVGLNVMYDELGNVGELDINLAYAYRRAFNFAPGFFSLGLDVGYVQQTWKDNWVANDHPDIDPSIPGGTSSSLIDLGLGLYWYNGDDYYAGFSVAHLNEPSFPHTGTTWNFDYPRYRTYYFHAGNKFRPFNTVTPLQLQHSVYFKYDVVEWTLDYNINLLINNFFWVGPSYRVDRSISILGGMDFGAVAPGWEGLKIGVAYDVSALSNFNEYNSGSFELMINYCYKITPPVKIRKYRTVKWL
ncbi:MAG: PorP/SprF family type IX secretion system membrane protein [Vicingaceae bacterium]